MPVINLAPGQQAQMQNCVNDAATHFHAAAALVALAGPAPAINLRWRVRREGTNTTDLVLFVGATGIDDDYQYLISAHGGPVPMPTHNSPTAVPANQWVVGAIPAAVNVP